MWHTQYSLLMVKLSDWKVHSQPGQESKDMKLNTRQHKTNISKECKVKNDMNMNIRQCETNHSKEWNVHYNMTWEIKIMSLEQHETNYSKEWKVKYNKMREWSALIIFATD